MRAHAALLLALLPTLPAAQTPDPQILSADYAEPTTRYRHGVLGDEVEWGAITLGLDRCPGCTEPLPDRVTLRLPETRVFEDVAPRLADVDGDGLPEVVVVETDLSLGARLAIYDAAGLVAATPFIGQTHRWLAPVGVADLDGDGAVELAYVDRPHLARTLRVWRYANGALTEVASAPGLTNHRIGEPTIGGGLRLCEDRPEMVTADADWARIVGTRLVDGVLVSRDLGPFEGRASLTAALSCQ